MNGGTSMGAMESLVGGGLVESDLEVWGQLWWSQNHHEVGVVTAITAVAGAVHALQPSLGKCGGPHKIHKNEWMQGF